MEGPLGQTPQVRVVPLCALKALLFHNTVWWPILYTDENAGNLSSRTLGQGTAAWETEQPPGSMS